MIATIKTDHASIGKEKGGRGGRGVPTYIPYPSVRSGTGYGYQVPSAVHVQHQLLILLAPGIYSNTRVSIDTIVILISPTINTNIKYF